MITIRKTTIDDIQAIMQLRDLAIKHACRDHYAAELLNAWTHQTASEKFIQHVKEKFYVTTNDNKIIGSGMLDPESGKIDAIFVHPDNMRSGIGLAMMRYLEELALRQGLKTINLESTLNAVEFYRRCGFTDEQPSIYHSPSGISLDCVLMQKTIGDN